MNFLVSANHHTVLQFQGPMVERGEVEWLVRYSELLAHAALAEAALIVIDVAVPGYEGQQQLRQLKQCSPKAKLLLAGARLSPEQELAALAAGALGCCSPELGDEQVRRILSTIEEGGVWISNAALPKLLQRLRSRSEKAEPQESITPPVVAPPPADSGMTGLTHREMEIAHMVAAGDSNKVIARKLDISDRTVKSHLTTIFQKLNVQDRLQLALLVSKGGA
jgi:DNA-binding NarL/FixJ family response regulator